MTAKSGVYSYLRFSDPKPAAESSADPQVEHARGREAEPGIQFGSSLSLRAKVSRSSTGFTLSKVNYPAMETIRVLQEHKARRWNKCM